MVSCPSLLSPHVLSMQIASVEWEPAANSEFLFSTTHCFIIHVHSSSFIIIVKVLFSTMEHLMSPQYFLEFIACYFARLFYLEHYPKPQGEALMVKFEINK